MRAGLQSVRSIIESALDALDVLLLDWSSWDDTSNFMETRDRGHIVSNLTPTQVARGTGLGLPIARSIVELHGGTLRAESDGQTGTVMRVEIPLDPPGPPLAPR